MSELNVETELAPTIRPLARLSATTLSAEWADPERGQFMTMLTLTASLPNIMDGGVDYDHQ